MDDYISRKAAREAFENADADVCESYPDGACDWGFGMKNIQEVIDGIPAADVEPVRRSYWESYDTSQYMGTDEFGEPKWRPGRFYVCHDRRCRRKTVVKSNYCPSCGAKMNLEGENLEN